MLRTAFDWVLSLSLTGAGAWLLTQLARLWTERRCSAQWQFRLRLAVLGAFLLPVGRAVSACGDRLQGLEATAAPAAGQAPPSLYVLSASLAASSPMSPGLWGRLIDLVPLLWALGAAAVCLVTLVRQGRFQRRLARLRVPAEDPELGTAAAQVGEALGLRGAVRLYLLPGLASPFGAGLVRPAVYLPQVPMDAQERRLILAHELAHLRRRDLWVKWLALAVCALHWFDPFAWLLREELGRLCELACDEAATAGMDAAGKRRYGEALLDVLCQAAPSAGGVCAPLCQRPVGLRQRLKRLLAPGRDPGVQARCSALAALALAVLLPLTGPLHAWAAPERVGGGGTLADYRAWEALHNARYEALGVVYRPEENAFYHDGQRLTLFVDQRPLSAEERERYPWCGAAFDCAFRDPDWPDGPCLRTVRGGDGALSGLEPIPPAEAAGLLSSARPVTFRSRYIDGGRLYASDPALDALPSGVLAQALALEPGTWTVLREPDGAGETGYLCCAVGQRPWRLDLRPDGGLDVSLYAVEGGDPALPTVIRYAAARPVGEIRLYLDGAPME